VTTYPAVAQAPGRRSPLFSAPHPPRPRALPDVSKMKSALVLAFTVYGIAAVISFFVAGLIKGLFVVVRRFSR
jgi:hypothetical protein